MNKVLLHLLLCTVMFGLAACGGCTAPREYVYLTYESAMQEQAPARHAPIRIAIATFTDARKRTPPNVLGYFERRKGKPAGEVVLSEYASLAEAMTQDVVKLYRLHGFEVFADAASAQAEGRLDGDLKGEIVTFEVNTKKGTPLGKVEGEGVLALELWHPRQGKLLWKATLKGAVERDYQLSVTGARFAAANDVYRQILGGVEQNISQVEERIEKLYLRGK